MIKTPEMLEATHKRHMDNWRAEVEEDLLERDEKLVQDVKKRYDTKTPPFSGFPGIEKIL